MRAFPAGFFLFWLSLSAAAPLHNRAPKQFSITVDHPAFIGEPIWVNKTTRPHDYFFVSGECIQLELLHDGKLVPRWPVKYVSGGAGSTSWSPISMMAANCLPTALRNPSGHRLPLHVWFQIRQPGRYALHWVSERPPDVRDNKSVTTPVGSAWITFTVLPASAADREKWLSHLLAHPPENASLFLSDYIPSLVAAAPDQRALEIIAAQLYSSDIVAGSAAEALTYFPEDRVRAAIFELIQKRGPTDFLAHLVSWNSFGLDADPDQRAQMTRTCFGYLRSSDPEKVAAAIEMMLFNVHGKNPTPTDPKLLARADDEVLNAAADIAGAGREDPQRELILYMRCIKSPEGRRRLVSMAHSGGAASDIANTALIFDHDPEAQGPLLLEVKEHIDLPHKFKTEKSYGLTITNLTGNTVNNERGIAIERKTPEGWKQETAIQAVASCAHYDQSNGWKAPKAPVALAPHSSFAVYSWDGFLCGGQCEDNCLANAYSGPGIFRFVVVLLPDGKRIASLPFAFSEP
jgi:hypothetical protein